MTHSQQVISKNNDVLLNTINIQTGFRGFLLTGDENFLEPFNKSKKEIIPNLNLLKTLTKNNENQQRYISLLKKQIDLKIATLSKNIDYFKKKNINAIEKKDVFKVEKNQTDRIKKLIEDINKIEVQLFNKHKLDNDKENQYSSIILLTILFLLILVSIVIINSIKNQTNRNDEYKISFKK